MGDGDALIMEAFVPVYELTVLRAAQPFTRQLLNQHQPKTFFGGERFGSPARAERTSGAIGVGQRLSFRS